VGHLDYGGAVGGLVGGEEASGDEGAGFCAYRILRLCLSDPSPGRFSVLVDRDEAEQAGDDVGGASAARGTSRRQRVVGLADQCPLHAAEFIVSR